MANLTFTSRVVLEYTDFNCGKLRMNDTMVEVFSIKEATLNDIINNLVKEGYLVEDKFFKNVFTSTGKIWPRIPWIKQLCAEKHKMDEKRRELQQDYEILREIDEKQKELEQKQIDAISKIMPIYKAWCENREEHETHREQAWKDIVYLSF